MRRVEDSDQFLLRIGRRTLYVSELVALILQAVQEGKDRAELLAEVNRYLHPEGELTQEELDQIVKEKILALDFERTDSESLTDSIKFRTVLLRYEQVAPLLSWLRPLYKAQFFYSVLACCAATSLWWILAHESNDAPISPYAFVAFPLCVGVIALFHELGHAAASQHFDVRPKELGFGIYLFYPVFYADVTDIWRLGKWKRTIVNFGGMHAQLCLNIPLILLWSGVNSPAVQDSIRSLIVFNSALILVNLNPFMKLDGYWVLSDLVEIPNLRQASFSVLEKVFRRPSAIGASLRLPLFWYSLGSIVFFAILLAMAMQGAAKTFLTKPTVLSEKIGRGEFIGAMPIFIELLIALLISTFIAIKILPLIKRLCRRIPL